MKSIVTNCKFIDNQKIQGGKKNVPRKYVRNLQINMYFIGYPQVTSQTKSTTKM